MKKVRLVDESKEKIIIVCGLSNGDINILTINSNNKLQAIGEFINAHDFGVNCLDAKSLDN
jgi:hypothetical protein